MSEPFVAEITMFAGTFNPRGYAFCNGQLLPISQNTALFSLLGTNYGGNGQSTFALPNLQGCLPVHSGQGPGLSYYDLGQSGGSTSVSLLTSEMPAHTHSLALVGANTGAADQSGPIGNLPASPASGTPYADTAGARMAAAAPVSLAPTGGTQPHDNMMPYLGVNFIIALQGVFPARN